MKGKTIKGLRFIELVHSQGFLIPVQHTKARVGDGLEIGKTYDLTIIESSTEEEKSEVSDAQ